ncbi:DNA helicase UvrD [Georgenia sp. 311]|uniref:3'-5' exonuclease n=1 Tax=Georgenia sp. 311 TaxID=2585134 RepID=UPI001112BC8C|nr:3'-5' exonuclease [Georgenia sp. 311]TNC16615.1 DNA helicase UvrD [Georgenia sp. 311]
MPQIILGPSQTKKIDGSVKKAGYAFLEKLAADDAVPGLHIEPINGSADPRVRTGRVNDFYRAVLFKVQGQGDEAHYVYLGILPHDDAIAFAKTARLKVNPVNGIAELVKASEPVAAQPAAEAAPEGGHGAGGAAPQPPVHETEPAAEAWSLLETRGVDKEALLDLGIDAALADRAMEATSDDSLIAAVEAAPQWQALALIDLAGGKPVEDVRADLGIDRVELSGDEETDEELLAALQHDAAKLQFAFIEDDEELRKAIEDDDFAAWRVFLHPEQRRYATGGYNGAFRLSGGAGTGKTVVLLHRARLLAKRDPGARILLTTFNKVLADSLRTDLRRLDSSVPIASRLGEPGIYIAGVDSAVHSVIQMAGSEVGAAITEVLGSRSPSIGGRTPASNWLDAAATVPDLPEELRSTTFFQAEYSMVVLPERITTRDEYLRVRRPGRGVALDRRKRQLVWQVVEAYRARASVEGSIDYGELAAVAAAYLEKAGCGVVDHVLVDEGQDLEPAKWQFLRALVPEGPDDLFIAEDSHQRIYGQRVVLGRYGIRIVGRARRLTLNYRTTAENLRYAMAVLAGGEYLDMEGEEEDSALYRSARSGPEPELVPTDSLGDGLSEVAGRVQRWLDDGVAPETIGLLVRDARRAQELVQGLEEHDVPVRVVDAHRDVRPGRPLVMTMHRAKGMEFSRVVLFDVSHDTVPAAYAVDKLTEGDRADALLRERSLLYVAASRARDELVVVWRGQPSELLP